MAFADRNLGGSCVGDDKWKAAFEVKFDLFDPIEMTGDYAKLPMALHGEVRCQPVGPSLILLGEVLTAP